MIQSTKVIFRAEYADLVDRGAVSGAVEPFSAVDGTSPLRIRSSIWSPCPIQSSNAFSGPVHLPRKRSMTSS